MLAEAREQEFNSGLARDKAGLAISKIEWLAFRTDFDAKRRLGLIPVNVSFFREASFSRAMQEMRPAFEAELCASDLVAVAGEGQSLGEVVVPEGRVGLATVCSVAINGALLKAGVPMDSRFGGILQVRNRKPFRFVELIHYSGSSLDPSEVFIRAGMTSVRRAAKDGNGRVLANFREIPAQCRDTAADVLAALKEAGLGSVLVMGETSGPVCEVPVELNRIGVILLGGLNPVAAAEEAGVRSENYAMSTVMEYQHLTKFREL
jgi:repressor of nif and glnA expression